MNIHVVTYCEFMVQVAPGPVKRRKLEAEYKMMSCACISSGQCITMKNIYCRHSKGSILWTHLTLYSIIIPFDAFEICI